MRTYTKYCNTDILNWAKFIIDNSSTVRDTATKFNVPKSSVHSCITTILEDLDSGLFREVHRILEINREEATSRGGIATKKKYDDLKVQ